MTTAAVIARFMLRTPALLILALSLLSFQANCEETPAESRSDGKMLVRGYPVPSAFFMRADVQDKNGQSNLVDGVHAILGNSSDLDVSEFLKTSGINFPRGSMALYNQEQKVMSVLNTPENLKRVDNLLLPACENEDGCDSGLVNAELTAIEFTAPASDQVLSLNTLAYSDFVKMAGKTSKVVGHVSMLGKSCMKSLFHQTYIVPTEKKGGSATRPRSAPAGAFKDGEFGSVVEWLPTVGPGSSIIECNLVCRFRFDFQGRDVLVDFLTTCETRDGGSEVVHVSPIPGKEGKYLAIILRLQTRRLQGRGDFRGK